MIDLEIIQESLSNLVGRAIEFTPRILSAFVILLIGWIVAKFLKNLVQRLADRIGFNQAIERTGLADGLSQAQISQTPSAMLGIFIFWLIFLNFLMAAVESLGLAVVVAQLQALIAYLPHLLSAIFALIVGALLAQFVGQLTQAGVASMGVEFHRAIGQAVRGILLLVTMIVAVEQLGLDVSVLTNIVTYLIAIIVAGLALAFGLGGREVARNVLAGHYARETFAPGNRLVIDGNEGTLEAIGTLNCEILIGQERLIVPNTHLTETQIKIIDEKL
ncbi:MAG: mechanosensitive ion channel [Anaerolineae bacterium]|nr:mechanosensitive ion channel [Anaerolineae bacterium]